MILQGRSIRLRQIPPVYPSKSLTTSINTSFHLTRTHPAPTFSFVRDQLVLAPQSFRCRTPEPSRSVPRALLTTPGPESSPPRCRGRLSRHRADWCWSVQVITWYVLMQFFWWFAGPWWSWSRLCPWGSGLLWNWEVGMTGETARQQNKFS